MSRIFAFWKVIIRSQVVVTRGVTCRAVGDDMVRKGLLPVEIGRLIPRVQISAYGVLGRETKDTIPINVTVLRCLVVMQGELFEVCWHRVRLDCICAEQEIRVPSVQCVHTNSMLSTADGYTSAIDSI